MSKLNELRRRLTQTLSRRIKAVDPVVPARARVLIGVLCFAVISIESTVLFVEIGQCLVLMLPLGIGLGRIYLLGACVTVMAAAWLICLSVLSNLSCYIRVSARRVAELLEEPSKADLLAAECVKNSREQRRMIIADVIPVVLGALAASGETVSLKLIVLGLKQQAQRAVAAERSVFWAMASDLDTLYYAPAGHLFDEALREGACPQSLVEAVLGAE